MNRIKVALAIVMICSVGVIGIGLLSSDIFVNKGTPHENINIHSDNDISNYNFTGSGSRNDPYLISGLYIVHESTCIEIWTTEKYFIIENCYLVPGGGNGIEIRVSSGSNVDGQYIIRNCIITSTSYYGVGIAVSQSLGCNIIDNTISGAHVWGINVGGHDNCKITGNKVSGGGISISDGDNIQCTDNTVLDCEGNGIDILRITSSPAVTGNRIERCEGNGMDINARNLVVENNYISNCGENGIFVFYNNGMVVENNTILNNLLDGIHFEGWSSSDVMANCKAIANTIDGNGGSGIYLIYTQGATLTDNDLVNNGEWGIHIVSSTSYTTSGNYYEGNILGAMNP